MTLIQYNFKLFRIGNVFALLYWVVVLGYTEAQPKYEKFSMTINITSL